MFFGGNGLFKPSAPGFEPSQELERLNRDFNKGCPSMNKETPSKILEAEDDPMRIGNPLLWCQYVLQR
jgi:hypothetical protein